MMVSGPLFHTRANWTRCANGHRPRDAGTSTRGNCIRLHACQKVGCGSHVLGIQNTGLDITCWYSVTRAQFKALVETPTDTHVLELLAIAGYHREDDAPQEAA